MANLNELLITVVAGVLVGGLTLLPSAPRYGAVLSVSALVVIILVLQPGIPPINAAAILNRMRPPSFWMYALFVLPVICAVGVFSEYRRDVDAARRLKALAASIRRFDLECKANLPAALGGVSDPWGGMASVRLAQARYEQGRQAQYLLNFRDGVRWALDETERRGLIDRKSATLSLLEPKDRDNAARFLDNLANVLWRPKAWIRFSLFRTVSIGILVWLMVWILWVSLFTLRWLP